MKICVSFIAKTLLRHCQRRNEAVVGSPERRAAGLDCWQLFDAYVRAKKLAEGTVTRWRAVFLQMQRDIADIGAIGITEDAARSWVALSGTVLGMSAIGG